MLQPNECSNNTNRQAIQDNWPRESSLGSVYFSQAEEIKLRAFLESLRVGFEASANSSLLTVSDVVDRFIQNRPCGGFVVTGNYQYRSFEKERITAAKEAADFVRNRSRLIEIERRDSIQNDPDFEFGWEEED